MPTPHHPSISIRRVLRKLGLDIREARIRRGLPAQVIAQRAFTTRPTLSRVERGDPGVGIGIYASVLQALGFLEGMGLLADPRHDEIGSALASEQLPQRAKRSRIKATHDD